MKTNEM